MDQKSGGTGARGFKDIDSADISGLPGHIADEQNPEGKPHQETNSQR